MSVGVQIGPECIPGYLPGCGAEASGKAALGSCAAVDGLAGNTSPASGDSEGSFQSGWHQLIEALGLRSGENPGEGKPVEALSAPSFEKPAPSAAMSILTRASGSRHKAEETVAAPREARGVRTEFPAGKKAAGAGSKAAVQAHESRKGAELNKPSAAAGTDPASGSGFQLIAVSTPDIAARRGDPSPTLAGVRGELFASETPGAREGRLATSAVDGEAMAKGSLMGPTSAGVGSSPVNGSADEPDGKLPNRKGTAVSMGEEVKLDSTAAAVNPGGQEPGQGLNDSLPAVRPAHAATETAITNAAAATIN